jgi:hypothetical protein
VLGRARYHRVNSHRSAIAGIPVSSDRGIDA